MDLPAAAETAATVICAVVTVASAFCAVTPTPAPATLWGRVYRWIEIAGVLVGNAKDRGLVGDVALADKIADAIDPPKPPEAS
jgi:hypothetical protein